MKKIEDVSLTIDFFNDDVGSILEEFDTIEDYVSYILAKETNIYDMFRVGLEAPIDEIVYFYVDGGFTGEGEEGLYPQTEEELQILIEIYNELLKAWNTDKVRIMVTSNSLWEDCNAKDYSLEEFLEMFELVEE